VLPALGGEEVTALLGEIDHERCSAEIVDITPAFVSAPEQPGEGGDPEDMQLVVVSREGCVLMIEWGPVAMSEGGLSAGSLGYPSVRAAIQGRGGPAFLLRYNASALRPVCILPSDVATNFESSVSVTVYCPSLKLPGLSTFQMP
jgi:hypothetical protein